MLQYSLQCAGWWAPASFAQVSSSSAAAATSWTWWCLGIISLGWVATLGCLILIGWIAWAFKWLWWFLGLNWWFSWALVALLGFWAMVVLLGQWAMVVLLGSLTWGVVWFMFSHSDLGPWAEDCKWYLQGHHTILQGGQACPLNPRSLHHCNQTLMMIHPAQAPWCWD